mmetsp:Transcript_12518/g.31919  ORF Transcript_12518/g.31919 Transcript_12518/m.31919 type:complete len:116 (+) Transcript_12518:166-513(+)
MATVAGGTGAAALMDRQRENIQAQEKKAAVEKDIATIEKDVADAREAVTDAEEAEAVAKKEVTELDDELAKEISDKKFVRRVNGQVRDKVTEKGRVVRWRSLCPMTRVSRILSRS